MEKNPHVLPLDFLCDGCFLRYHSKQLFMASVLELLSEHYIRLYITGNVLCRSKTDVNFGEKTVRPEPARLAARFAEA